MRTYQMAMKMLGAIAFTVFAGTGLPLVAHGLRAQTKPDVMALTPEEMKWGSQGGLALPGMEQASLVGDPAKPGPYTLRLKFPAGYKLEAHTHPDYREVTVLSGTWHTGTARSLMQGH